jgi:hypothetical protein
VTDETVPGPAPEPVPQHAPPPIAPVDVDGVGAITYGTVAWAVGVVLCLVFRSRLAESGREWWLWVCVTGALLGVAGLVFVRRRAAVYRAATRAGASQS